MAFGVGNYLTPPLGNCLTLEALRLGNYLALGQLKARDVLVFRPNQEVSLSFLDLGSLEVVGSAHSQLEPGEFELMIEGAVSLLGDDQTTMLYVTHLEAEPFDGTAQYP